MPDITKCANKECPFRMNCFRFTAVDSYWQSYANFSIDPETGECDDYYPVTPAEPKKGRKNVTNRK
jgi:hypothetical protein